MMEGVVADLAAEQDVLDGLVSDLDDAGWRTPTPSAGWDIVDQISHLAYFDHKAAQTVTDPDGFLEYLAALSENLEDEILVMGRQMSGAELVSWWRAGREALCSAMRSVEPDRRLPWYGPPMKAYSSAQARLMECWAHGQDVADALGTAYPPSDRIHHVAELGVKTFSWSFRNRGMEVPRERVRVALRGSSGLNWVWNDASAACVTGPLRDFCLVVTQRRHVDDTRLVIEGDLAATWMGIAQAYAGPPGPGRSPT